jgi:hypothetical protein
MVPHMLNPRPPFFCCCAAVRAVFRAAWVGRRLQSEAGVGVGVVWAKIAPDASVMSAMKLAEFLSIVFFVECHASIVNFSREHQRNHYIW